MRHCQRRRDHTPADGRDPERRRDVRGGLRQRDDGVGLDPERRRRLRDRCHHRRRVSLVGTIGDPANLRGLVLVGLDVGAIRATAVAIDETGAVQASASAEYPPDGKASGGLERDASEWWRASQRALAEVAATAGGEVVGIGLTGQTAGAVFMDARGNVVRPAIVGGDRRALRQSVAITERVGRDRLLEITGEAVTDVTDASGTTLLDLRRRTWSGEILDALEIPPAWLPDVQESAAISGGLRPSMAGELGLPARLPIAAGASAEAAAAVGCGIVESGLISSSIRRDAVLFAPADHVI